MKQSVSIRVCALLVAAALVMLGANGFQQAVQEFRGGAAGSTLFGALHLLMGAASALAAFGLWRRATWTTWAIGVAGGAGIGLFAALAFDEPAGSDARQAMWSAAAIIGAGAVALAWFAWVAMRPRQPQDKP